MKAPFTKTLAILVVLLAMGRSARAQYTYTTLDDPLGAGGTHAQGISGTNVVGYYVDTNASTHGFLCHGNSWITLDDPLGVNGTYPQGISGTNIVGYYYDGSNTAHGFIYNGSTWTTLDAPEGPYGTFALAVDGTNIVGSYIDTNDITQGFLYNSSVWTTLDTPAQYVTGISGTSMVGWSYGWGPADSGFLYTGNTWTTLADPNGSIAALGIEGTNIVGRVYDPNGLHGFLYNGSTWTTLDDPLGVDGTFASGISGPNIVGTYFDSGHAYLARGFLAMPIPQLSIAPSGDTLKLSWPSWANNYLLQQGFDLASTNWVQAPELPILNVSDGQYEVTLNPAFVLQNSHYNFRLKQQ